MKARVLKMEGAKDPDEYIKKYGAEAFAHLIDISGGAIDFELSKLAHGLDFNKDEDRSSYLKRAVGFLAQITNPLDRAVYISRTAETARIPSETVRFAVEGEIARQKKKSARDEYRTLISPRNTDKINPESARLPREEKAERGLICHAFHNQDKFEYIRKKLTGEFATEFNARVFSFMERRCKQGERLDRSSFNEEFSPAEMGRIMGILNDFLAFAHDSDALKDYINTLNEYNENKKQINAAGMSAEDLLAFAQKQKEKKSQ